MCNIYEEISELSLGIAPEEVADAKPQAAEVLSEYVPQALTDNTLSLEEVVPMATDVAEIIRNGSSVKYASLTDAFADVADGETIKLLVINIIFNTPITLNKEGSFTFDLCENGVASGRAPESKIDPAITLGTNSASTNKNPNFTITNSVSSEVNFVVKDTCAIYNYGRVMSTDETATSASSGINAKSPLSKVVINDGTVLVYRQAHKHSVYLMYGKRTILRQMRRLFLRRL